MAALTRPSCGQKDPDEARFCNACASPLPTDERPKGEERKTVTVVFVDLVGFTAQAERLDPEDVRGLLSPYHAHVRIELKGRGGTVEKFIGDAVMAVFGAPVAHEDDPERAVRAAWSPCMGDPFREALSSLRPEQQLDLGCSLTCGAFQRGQKDDQLHVETCEESRALIFFALRLFRRLQLMGTVSAIDISRYGRVVWT